MEILSHLIRMDTMLLSMERLFMSMGILEALMFSLMVLKGLRPIRERSKNA